MAALAGSLIGDSNDGSVPRRGSGPGERRPRNAAGPRRNPYASLHAVVRRLETLAGAVEPGAKGASEKPAKASASKGAAKKPAAKKSE